jgi:predicted nucleotidyltransferase
VPRDGGVIAIDIPKEQLRDFCRKWKVTEFSLFGSVTRPNEFRSESDVDVMVRFEPEARWSFFHILEMKDELKAIFQREVDLCERPAVERMRNYLRREEILRTAVLLDDVA